MKIEEGQRLLRPIHLCIFIFKVGFRPWVACGKWNIRAYCRQMCTVHLRAKKSQLILHITIMPKHAVQQQICVAWKCEHPRHKCTLQCFSLVSSMELVYRQVWRCQTEKRMWSTILISSGFR